MKFIHSLEFRLISIVLSIFIVSNVGLTFTAIRTSTTSISENVEKLLNAVTDSAAGKVKGETEKQFRMLNSLARTDFVRDSEMPL